MIDELLSICQVVFARALENQTTLRSCNPEYGNTELQLILRRDVISGLVAELKKRGVLDHKLDLPDGVDPHMFDVDSSGDAIPLQGPTIRYLKAGGERFEDDEGCVIFPKVVPPDALSKGILVTSGTQKRYVRMAEVKNPNVQQCIPGLEGDAQEDVDVYFMVFSRGDDHNEPFVVLGKPSFISETRVGLVEKVDMLSSSPSVVNTQGARNVAEDTVNDIVLGDECVSFRADDERAVG